MVDLRRSRISQNVERGQPLPPRVLQFLAGDGGDEPFTIDEINREIWPYLQSPLDIYEAEYLPQTYDPAIWQLRRNLMRIGELPGAEERGREAQAALQAARQSEQMRAAVRQMLSGQQSVGNTLRLNY